MATYNKFNQTVKDLLDKKHNFSSDTFKIMLTNVAPVATNSVKADLTEIAAGSGYSAGGSSAGVSDSISVGVAKVSGVNVTFTSSGTIGPLRYAVLYNDTAAGDPLICWWDFGSSITLANTETLSVNFDPINGIFQLS